MCFVANLLNEATLQRYKLPSLPFLYWLIGFDDPRGSVGDGFSELYLFLCASA